MNVAAPSPARRCQSLVPAVLVAAAATLAYWPALTGGFIWDDDALLTQNALVKASDGLFRIWFTTEPLDYWPITNSSFWLEWRLWGAHPTGYHVTNLLLHITSALLVWAILGRLSIPGGFLAACLFALHPVNVESVAWIAQRKNMLSMVFFLVSILWYIRYERGPVALEPSRAPDHGADARAARTTPKSRRQVSRPAPAGPDRAGHGRWYWLSLAAFVLAMLSKGSVAILPGVLLLIAWWQRGTVTRRDLLRTTPFFVVAVALTILNIWFQTHLGTAVIRDVTVVQRLLGAAAVVWFYLYKALLPIGLIFVYPEWEIRSEAVRWWLPLIAALATTALLIWQRRRPVFRSLLFAWMFFGLALVPVMGLTDVYFMRYSLVADHYQYIAIIAVVACAAAAVVPGAAPADGRARAGHSMSGLGCGALLIVLGTLTWRQSQLYANAETVYLRTLSANPTAWLAHNNLALMYLHGPAANVQASVEHLRAALAIKPHEPSLHNNLGSALFRMDRFEEAAEYHGRAVRLDPAYADAHGNLGTDFQKLGRYAEAVDSYRHALRLRPDLGALRSNLAIALEALGRPDEANREFQQALQGDPRTVQEYGARGDALRRLGRTEEAIVQYREALRLDPGSVGTMNNLGYALRVVGRLDEAERQLREALRLQPGDAAVHDNLGNVLQQMQRFDEAIAEFNAALKTGSGPDVADIHNDMGVALARSGRLEEAIGHFREALRLKPALAAAQTNLAKALSR